jgi:plastocyanin
MSKARTGSLAVLAAGLLIYACGGSGHSGSAPTEPGSPTTKSVTVQIMDDSFNPKDVVVNPGDTVTWVLAGSLTTHTVTADNGSFDSGSIFTSKGASYSQTFNTAGVTINYHCKVHQACCGMQGSVRVGSTAPSPAPGY